MEKSFWDKYLPFLIYVFTKCSNTSWDSTVGIATGYGLDGQGAGFQVPVGARFFSSPHHPD
jgi:hypothetical protein